MIQLHESDNVAVAVRELLAGRAIEIGGGAVTLPQAIQIGHKIAIRPIVAGERVNKWGCPIGSATRDIDVGEHVHTHNLKSDYLPTFETGAYVAKT